MKLHFFGDFIAGPNGGNYTWETGGRVVVLGWVIGGTMGYMYAFHILEFGLCGMADFDFLTFASQDSISIPLCHIAPY